MAKICRIISCFPFDDATIETAKAQDYGKGFAVVASEVSSLAQRSREALKRSSIWCVLAWKFPNRKEIPSNLPLSVMSKMMNLNVFERQEPA